MSSYRKTYDGTAPDCPEFLERYIDYLKIHSAQSNNSILDTMLSLREFCQFLQYRLSHEGQDPADKTALKEVQILGLHVSVMPSLTHDLLERYLQFAETALGNSGGTIKKKITYLRKFFSYLVEYSDELGIHFPKGNPAAAIKAPSASVSSAASPILSPANVQAVLNSVPLGENFLRDQAIVALLATSTLTVSEISELNRDQVDIPPGFNPRNAAAATGTVTVYRNGKKCQIPLCHSCTRILQKHLAESDDAYPNDPLFLSSQKKVRLTERSIQKRIRIAAFNAGLTFVTAQVLRDTAIACLLSGAPDGCENLLVSELGYKTDFPLKRIAAQNILSQAAAASPLNRLED